MAAIDFTDYLSGLGQDVIVLAGIPSQKHPKGKTYNVPALNGEDWLLLQQITGSFEGQSPDGALVDRFCRDAEGNEVSFQQKLLGSALAEMLGDGINGLALERVCTVLVSRYSIGEEQTRLGIAKSVAEAKAAGEAPAAPAATKQLSPASTQPKAGPRSNPESGDTPAPTRSRTSGRSSAATPRATNRESRTG